MRDYTTQATQWIYGGIWSALVEWFKVPQNPPELPAAGTVRSFRPAEGFLRYMKLWFWLVLVVIDVLIIGGWIALLVAIPWLGLLLAIPALAIAIIPDVIAYIAIHLRYDTTWYVMSDRSLRIRRGIWTIHEMTITFENVQNVRVEQGPVQRYYGIADVMIDTAGASSAPAGKHQGAAIGNQAIIEGINNANEIRDLILQRLVKSKTAGLGDEDDRDIARNTGHPSVSLGPSWSPAHLAVLREIRDAALNLRP